MKKEGRLVFAQQVSLFADVWSCEGGVILGALYEDVGRLSFCSGIGVWGRKAAVTFLGQYPVPVRGR